MATMDEMGTRESTLAPSTAEPSSPPSPTTASRRRSSAPSLRLSTEAEPTRRQPAFPANHPVNTLSRARKTAILATLAFAGMMANFSVSIILTSFGPIGATFNVPTGSVPSTIGYALLGIALGPLLWNPLAATLGRRAVYVWGSALGLPVCVWLALSPSFASFSAARVVAGVLSAWSQTVPPCTVADIYVPQVRGAKMSAYGTAVVIAPAIAPFFGSLIVSAASWRVLFWFVLGLSALQLLAFVLLVPETLWVEDKNTDGKGRDGKDKAKEKGGGGSPAPRMLAPPGHAGAAYMPWQRPRAFLALCLGPLRMVHCLPIVVPSFYYGLLFAWSVGLTVVVPQTLEAAPYSFSRVALGCAFLAFGVGGVLGHWVGGVVGDKVVVWHERREARNGRGGRQPEDRLWALIPVLPVMLASLVVVGVCIERRLHWAGVLVSGGVYWFCLSAATGVIQTYTLECCLARSVDVGAVFTFCKMMWGYVNPYFAMEWAEKWGFIAAYATQGALAAGLGALLCAVLLWKGRAIRQWQSLPEFHK